MKKLHMSNRVTTRKKILKYCPAALFLYFLLTWKFFTTDVDWIIIYLLFSAIVYTFIFWLLFILLPPRNNYLRISTKIKEEQKNSGDWKSITEWEKELLLQKPTIKNSIINDSIIDTQNFNWLFHYKVVYCHNLEGMIIKTNINNNYISQKDLTWIYNCDYLKIDLENDKSFSSHRENITDHRLYYSAIICLSFIIFSMTLPVLNKSFAGYIMMAFFYMLLIGNLLLAILREFYIIFSQSKSKSILEVKSFEDKFIISNPFKPSINTNDMINVRQIMDPHVMLLIEDWCKKYDISHGFSIAINPTHWTFLCAWNHKICNYPDDISTHYIITWLKRIEELITKSGLNRELENNKLTKKLVL